MPFMIMKHRSAESRLGESHNVVRDRNGEIRTFETRQAAQAEAEAYNEHRISPFFTFTVEERAPAVL